MLSHDKVWAAIDALAARNALSASGLAKRAGLDSTAFNKSKRQSADGRPRWPSTESLAKVMDATGASIDDLLGLFKADGEARPAPSTVPLIGFAQAGAGGYFDDAGFPAGHGWDQVPLPAGAGEGAYALTVQGDSMLPLYRDGDVLIVDPAAQVRKGDRVVAKTSSGEVTAKVLARKSAKIVELQSLNPDHPDRSIPADDIVWMARIVWASQ
jgi:phage repressor protein C with HTH and peptisase S24 domain